MKKTMSIIAALALALVLLTACGGGGAVTLANSSWTGTLYGVATTLSFTDTGYTLTTADGTVLGQGEYSVNGSTLTWNDTRVSVSVQKSDSTEVLTIYDGSSTMSYTRAN